MPVWSRYIGRIESVASAEKRPSPSRVSLTHSSAETTGFNPKDVAESLIRAQC